MSEIGAYLRILREGKKLSLREAAEKSGLSHSYIRYLEDGKRPGSNNPINPSPETLRRLSEAYNHDYEDLMRAAGYLEEGEDNLTDEQKKARLELEEFLLNPNATIDGKPIPQSLRDDLLTYVRIQKAMGKQN